MCNARASPRAEIVRRHRRETEDEVEKNGSSEISAVKVRGAGAKFRGSLSSGQL